MIIIIGLVIGTVVVYALIGAGARRMFDHVDKPRRDETAPDESAPGVGRRKR